MATADAASVENVDAQGPTVVIATVNLRCLLEDWNARLPLLASEIAASGADLIALQEVCDDPGVRDALPDLKSALEAQTGQSYESHRASTHLAWDQYQEGIAILSPHSLVDRESLDLPAGVFPRKALLAAIDVDETRIEFAATHLSFGDQDATRHAQLEALRAELDGRGSSNALRIIAGDLNEGPAGMAVSAAVDAGYVDSWAHAHPFNDGPTYPADAPRSRIDYILANGPDLPGRILSVDRFLTIPTAGVYPSDHIAVRAELSLSP